MKKVHTIGAGLLLGAVAFAAQDFMPKFVYTKGEVTKYETRGKLNVQGMDIEIMMTVQSKVLSIGEDGSVEIQSDNLGGKVNFGGQEMDIPSTAGAITKMSKNGAILESRSESGEGGGRVNALQSFILPEKPIKPGDSWKVEIPAKSDLGTLKSEAEFTYVGDETMDGTEVVKIKSKITEVEGSDPASITAVTWLKKATMGMVKSEATWKDVPMPGAPMPISGTFVTKLIP